MPSIFAISRFLAPALLHENRSRQSRASGYPAVSRCLIWRPNSSRLVDFRVLGVRTGSVQVRLDPRLSILDGFDFV